MGNIIGTEVSGSADFKIENSAICDSTINDYAVVSIAEESQLWNTEISGNVLIKDSKLKYVTLDGNVGINHSIIEGCVITGGLSQFIECVVKNSVIHNISINKDRCVETIEDNEIFIPAGAFECEVIMNKGCIIVKFHTYNDVWVFHKRNFLDFIKNYYKLQGGAH